MKRIIDIDEDYFEIIKHDVKIAKGSDFKPFVLIANSVPYEERPQGEWIPIKTRPLTDEERKSISQYYGFNYDASNDYAFDCPMPEEGQEILISTPWGVSKDRCEYDCTDDGMSLFSLEDRGDWEDVNAWQPLPEPYKKGGTE